MKYVHWGKLFLALVAVYFVAGVALAEEIKPENEWVKGAIIIGVKNDGGCVAKPFVKVGITDHPDYEDAIIGYEPGNVQISRKGDIIWERQSDTAFIPLGKHKSINGRLCKAPPYNM